MGHAGGAPSSGGGRQNQRTADGTQAAAAQAAACVADGSTDIGEHGVQLVEYVARLLNTEDNDKIEAMEVIVGPQYTPGKQLLRTRSATKADTVPWLQRPMRIQSARPVTGKAREQAPTPLQHIQTNWDAQERRPQQPRHQPQPTELPEGVHSALC